MDSDEGWTTHPDPSQPDRCPSIDPQDTLQCGRRIHEDEHCRFGGLAWKKGTPRYLSAEERLTRSLRRVESLCDFWDKISKGETSTTRQIRAAIAGDST